MRHPSEIGDNRLFCELSNIRNRQRLVVHIDTSLMQEKPFTGSVCVIAQPIDRICLISGLCGGTSEVSSNKTVLYSLVPTNSSQDIWLELLWHRRCLAARRVLTKQRLNNSTRSIQTNKSMSRYWTVCKRGRGTVEGREFLMCVTVRPNTPWYAYSGNLRCRTEVGPCACRSTQGGATKHHDERKCPDKATRLCFVDV
ncbi:hypothetical protein IAQ61_010847 [Plenodomus lingam]|uniref:uncharacterized protein n=1 Tax=Leptosphaeria maculans TaxID=5022 RepID=UPI00332C1FB6|nr:hypothetical protein IAQ61_010847 [Plenodomus lingam]